MKFLISGLVLLAFYAILVNSDVPPSCPTEIQLGLTTLNSNKTLCTCFPLVNYLICTSTFDNYNNLTFKRIYKFNSANRNSSKSIEQEFQIETLVAHQDGVAKNDDLNLNLNQLIHLPVESIAVYSNTQIDQTVDISKLSPNLSTISLNQIQRLSHSFDQTYFDGFFNLESIQLVDVQFADPPNDTEIGDSNSSLSRIEFTNTNIRGTFSFTPNACPPNEGRIFIELHRNTNLTDFDFDSLFLNAPTLACQFHIDISDSAHMDADFLERQAKTIGKHPGKIYFIARNVPLECGCELYALYHQNNLTYSQNIHSVFCDNFGKFLSQITSRDIDDCTK